MDIDRAKDHLRSIHHSLRLSIEQRAIVEEGIRAIEDLQQRNNRLIGENERLKRDNAKLRKTKVKETGNEKDSDRA